MPSLPTLQAFTVHVLTASGAALGLLALLAATERRWSVMFAWLGLALFVDGVDGFFARRFRVAEVVPRWSGDMLDLVVDYVTYVLVPAYAIVISGLLPAYTAVPAGVLIVITAALYFADGQMKTEDHGFQGFPALWNAAAFYLFLFEPPAWASLVLVVALAALTFAPIPVLHPFRVRRGRALTVVLLVLWAALASIAIAQDMRPAPWIAWTVLGLGLYLMGASVVRSAIAGRQTF